MRHLRSDYNAIQPWPDKRPHIARYPDGHIGEVGPFDPAEVEPIVRDDEPVFLLRGQDPLAAATVLDYAYRAELAGVNLRVVDALREWALEMAKYADRAQHGLPDVPAHVVMATES